MTKKQKIVEIIIKKSVISSGGIKKYLNYSRNEEFKKTSANYINRTLRYLMKRKLILIAFEKRKKTANNYPIKYYSVNLQNIEKLNKI